jgi:hypothetical protein
MDALAVNAFSPAFFSLVSAPRPVPISEPPKTTTLTPQDLAQGVFQRTLQAATAFPLTEPAPGSLGLAQTATASLLAALTAPQAAADTTPTATTTVNPAAVPVADTTSTAPSPTPPTPALVEVGAAQGAADGSGTDFALATALRFGAGVAGEATPAAAPAELGTGLVRDASTVARQEGLQAHTGSPGPEAFTRPQALLERILRTYEAASTPTPQPQPVGLDLLA